MVSATHSSEITVGGIRNFDEAMDSLAEKMSSLGFPYTLYTHIETLRQPDGRFNPLPLTVRNFPKNWERLWHRFRRMDSYYHACFDTRYVVDWQKVRAENKLCAVQQEACLYLEDIGMNQGITVPGIAAILKRSPETVKYHVKNTYSKLGARNRGHAISQTAKLGLL